jgi:hypothetical protein
MRWFGPNDPVSLMDVRQSGCTGVVSALHQIAVGDVWAEAAILERISIIEKDNDKFSELQWLVVESLPVHEDIKKGLPSRENYIENYKGHDFYNHIPMFTSGELRGKNYKSYDFVIFDTHTYNFKIKMDNPSFCLQTRDIGCLPLANTYKGINKI